MALLCRGPLSPGNTCPFYMFGVLMPDPVLMRRRVQYDVLAALSSEYANTADGSPEEFDVVLRIAEQLAEMHLQDLSHCGTCMIETFDQVPPHHS